MYSVTPAISPEVTDQTQNEGDTASFTCQATSEPVAIISWYFNGALVNNETNMDKYDISQLSLNTTTISNTLTIMNVESSDVGTYICNATNVISTDISSGVLTVNGESVTYVCTYVDVHCIYTYFLFTKFSCSNHYYTNGRTVLLY